MKKIGIFYGSSTGTTESVAHTIAQKLGVASNDVHDASKLTGEMVKEYDVLVLGTSTWGCGRVARRLVRRCEGVEKGWPEFERGRTLRVRGLGVVLRYVL